MSADTKQNAQNPEDSLQPVFYGVLPVQNQLNDEIDLGKLFSSLVSLWKLILGITAGGTILAIIWAQTLPSVYQASVTVSVPSLGKVASVAAINTLLSENSYVLPSTQQAVFNRYFNLPRSDILSENSYVLPSAQQAVFNGYFNLLRSDILSENSNVLPSTQQAVFNRYFNLLRSDMVLAEYIHEKKFLKKLYPDTTIPESVLLAGLINARSVEIEEPTPEKKGGYIANPQRVKIKIEIKDEAVGVDLLNGFSSYANQRLIINLQNDVRETIENKIEVLNRQIAKQRDYHRQNRILIIKKMEQDNLKKITTLEEKMSSTLEKATANRATQIAHAREALEMAKSLDITDPMTFEMLVQRTQKSIATNTAITAVDKQQLSPYLQGSNYLSTLIKTLKNRKSDEEHLSEVNSLREEIYLIKNDQELAALKNRKSDDPWIESLPEKLSQIDALKNLNPDFTSLVAYVTDESAMITDEKVKPNRKLIVIIGFVLSLFIAIFLAVIVASMKSVKHESN